MKRCYIGVDTSNYTTSVGIVDEDGAVLANLKQLLPVAEGERGLRQSDALFHHVKNLPELLDRAGEYLGGREIAAVGVSVSPRNRAGSYMPCFLAGEAAAHALCAASGAPLFRFSHQCGHIMAALLSAGRLDLLDAPAFGAFHVSGGTTELLRVSFRENGFSAESCGGTKDLNAGQVIDRIGVALGLRFPCGPALEELALTYKGKVPRRKPSLCGSHINLSGLENMALKLWQDTGDAPQTAAFVFSYLAEALAGAVQHFLGEQGALPMVFAGGVMCNSFLRRRLSRFPDASFADPRLSADNAVGSAALAWQCSIRGCADKAAGKERTDG